MALVAGDHRLAHAQTLGELALRDALRDAQPDEQLTEAAEVLELAELATAEYYMAAGDVVNGQTQAFRAMRSLVEGSPGWRRAKDIYEFVPENRR